MNNRKQIIFSFILCSLAFQPLHAAAGAPDNTYCGLGNVPKFGASDGPAALPQACFFTAMSATPSPGAVTTVPASATAKDIQKLLDNAQCGDTIVFTAGVSYAAPIWPGYILRAKGCDDNHWITLRTSASDSQLPPEGTRISPCYANAASLPGRPAYDCPSGGAAALMPTLVTNGTPVFQVDPGATHYRLIGLEMTQVPGTSVDNKLVDLAGGDHVIVDRCYIHGTPQDVLQGGVRMAGTYIAVIDSYLSDSKCLTNPSPCTDSQAVGAGTGDYLQGPIKVVNNFLESAAESFLFGGGNATVTASDIEIRRNYSSKPPTLWRSDSPQYLFGSNDILVKNLGEFKHAARVLMEGNVFENNWQGQADQSGFAILLSPKNANNGDPTAVVNDITIRYNRIAHSTSGMQISAVKATRGETLSQGIHRVAIHDNLFDDINYAAYTVNYPGTGPGGKGFFFGNADTDPNTWVNWVAIQHNTMLLVGVLYTGGFLGQDQEAPSVFFDHVSWADNIASAHCEGTYLSKKINGSCADVINELDTHWTFQNNVLPDNLWPNQKDDSPYPDTNQTCNAQLATCFPDSWDKVAFVNYNNGNGGDYHLASASPYKNAGTDGRDIGANIDGVNCAIYNVVGGGPLPANCNLINLPGSYRPDTPTLNLPAYVPITGTIAAGYNGEDPAVAFDWTFTSVDQIPQGAPAKTSGVVSQAPSQTLKTQSPQASLSAVSLSLGPYLVTVAAVDANNNVSASAQAYITLVPGDLSGVRVYPNPWRSDKHAGRPVTFDSLTVNTTIKIFTVSGHLVKTLPTSSTVVIWDLTNDSGEKVASGLYFYLLTADSGQKKTGTLAVIK